MNERHIHRVFQVSVILKGAHALIECIGGLALALASRASISALVNQLTQEELIEDPRDFVATHLLRLGQAITSKQNFYALYLSIHGIVKVGLVVGLLKNKLWSYPTSLVVLGLFIAYQIYRILFTQSLGLFVLTLFDVIVVVLIWHEYNLVRQRRDGRTDPGPCGIRP
jgi:uncharacterized membrane protein